MFYCKNCETYYDEPYEVFDFGNGIEYGCTCGSTKIRPVKVRNSSKSGRFIDIQNDVIKLYGIECNDYCRFGSKTRTHAHIKERCVCKFHKANSLTATFTLLHEIGHIQNNDLKMRRCEKEYFATVWALEEAKRYGLVIPEKTLDGYRDYINRELDRGLRRGGKNYLALDMELINN